MKRIYKGKKRKAKRIIGQKWNQELLQWALSIKPGDYIATCEGCNRKVATIEPMWMSVGEWSYPKRRTPRCKKCRRKNQFLPCRHGKATKTIALNEVTFTDTRGRSHCCPGGGCAYPKETPESITEYFKGWVYGDDESGFTSWKDEAARFKEMRRRLDAGLPIVDEFGELLPECDR